MSTEEVERRLAAIVAADVAGYSRLMGTDEEGTLAALRTHRREFLDLKIAEHRGRIVKTTGDGFLIEFASVVDATRCAVGIQDGMRERNVSVPQDKRLEFRIGINVGDVIDHDDIARRQGRRENAAHIIQKPRAVDGALEGHGRDHSRQPQSRNEGRSLPTAERDPGAQTLARRPAVKRRHVAQVSSNAGG